ncbi:hypothetical protein SI65_10105 [Aspergillus cristatus]|uniref:Uncharacterized protein n=1 Tax=Aspergillus cristatus TaxID=573508 RepID=A0A1E3B0M0_ASPCR|nr:hypothetical protein SI65_10105 [Aspergillus cristatus]
MESALELISRPLPPLNKLGGTTYPLRSNENVSARFFYEWENFESDVIRACASLDLSQLVSLTDEVEEYRTASELGLTGRFSKHVCDAVMKALSVTHLSNMKFGDYQALPPHDAEKVPDVVMLSLLDSTALLVG